MGIRVSIVDVNDVEICGGVQRAMARRAESELVRRAKVIDAEVEFQASERLKDEANVMSVNPVAVQLRFPQTMFEVISERSTTMVMPIPIDLLQPFSRRGVGRDEPSVPTNGHVVAAGGCDEG